MFRLLIIVNVVPLFLNLKKSNGNYGPERSSVKNWCVGPIQSPDDLQLLMDYLAFI